MLQLIIGEKVPIHDICNDIEHSEGLDKSDALLNYLLSRLSTAYHSEDKLTAVLTTEMFDFPVPMQTKEQTASTAKDCLITYNDAKNMIPGKYSQDEMAVPNTSDIMSYSKPL